MFIPFSIKKTTIEVVCGNNQYEYDTDYITKSLKANINLDTIKQSLIKGTKLQEEWFPSESYDSQFKVFISHSHKDLDMVKNLAGFLKEHYGIRSFIDSLYWGYVNDLQKSIDDYYASYERENKKYYDYDKRNFLTANVHILLSMALMKMMDACECLIFVDSDNSLKYELGAKETPSPWIYEEMGFANRLRINVPLRFKEKIKVTLNESRERSSYSYMMFSQTGQREANFSYEVDMRHFKELERSDFPISKGYDSDAILDTWYKKYGVGKLLNRIIGHK